MGGNSIKRKIISCVWISFFFYLYSVQAQEVDRVKIGVYEYEPYIQLNEEGKIEGYYADLMRLLKHDLSFDYELIVLPFSDGMSQLISEDLDIMLGISMNNQFKDELIFNHYRTNKEIFGLFSLEEVSLNELKRKKDLKLGLVRGDTNAKWVLDFLKANEIEVSVFYGKDYQSLSQKLENHEIDLYVDNRTKASDYYLAYEFIGEDLYIASNPKSQWVIQEIDEVLEQLMIKGEDVIPSLSEEYFSSEVENHYWGEIILWFIILVMLLVIYPSLKRTFMRNQIRKYLKSKRYVLKYQPIYDPKTNEVIAFESVLKLRSKNRRILSTEKMNSQIKKYGMSSQVTLWMLNEVMKDYDKIKLCRCVRESSFYISINLSLNDLVNEQLVEAMIKKGNQSNLKRGSICLDIVERGKLNELNHIKRHIQSLKQANFMIAIDEFGVNTTNLDVLHQLDTDVIKISKLFVDGIEKDHIKEEIILFISKFAVIKNQLVILQGIEHSFQHDFIVQIQNERLYVQGDYYHKPVFVEEVTCI